MDDLHTDKAHLESEFDWMSVSSLTCALLTCVFVVGVTRYMIANREKTLVRVRNVPLITMHAIISVGWILLVVSRQRHFFRGSCNCYLDAFQTFVQTVWILVWLTRIYSIKAVLKLRSGHERFCIFALAILPPLIHTCIDLATARCEITSRFVMGSGLVANTHVTVLLIGTSIMTKLPSPFRCGSDTLVVTAVAGNLVFFVMIMSFVYDAVFQHGITLIVCITVAVVHGIQCKPAILESDTTYDPAMHQVALDVAFGKNEMKKILNDNGNGSERGGCGTWAEIEGDADDLESVLSGRTLTGSICGGGGGGRADSGLFQTQSFHDRLTMDGAFSACDGVDGSGGCQTPVAAPPLRRQATLMLVTADDSASVQGVVQHRLFARDFDGANASLPDVLGVDTLVTTPGKTTDDERRKIESFLAFASAEKPRLVAAITRLNSEFTSAASKGKNVSVKRIEHTRSMLTDAVLMGKIPNTNCVVDDFRDATRDDFVTMVRETASIEGWMRCIERELVETCLGHYRREALERLERCEDVVRTHPSFGMW